MPGPSADCWRCCPGKQMRQAHHGVASARLPRRLAATPWFELTPRITYFNKSVPSPIRFLLPTSDTNAVIPANAALVNGTNSFNLTFKTAGSQTVVRKRHGRQQGHQQRSSFRKRRSFRETAVVNTRRDAVPGTPRAKPAAPAAEIARQRFQLRVNGVDSNWNVVPGASGAGFAVQISSSDTKRDIAFQCESRIGNDWRSNVALPNCRHQRPLLLPMRVTAPRPRARGPAITSHRAPFSRLQVLLPGEMAVAGSLMGRPQHPPRKTAGICFLPPRLTPWMSHST